MNDNLITRNGINYRIRIEQDTDAQDPFKNDEGLGDIFTLHRHSRTLAKAENAIKNNKDAVLLSVYSHSGEYWSVRGELPAMMQCGFDSVAVAGVWIPNECLEEELKELDKTARKERCEILARQACEVYNQYLSGDVWGFIIEKQNQCSACKHEEWEHIHSCWEFYGYETASEAAKLNLEYHISEESKLKGGAA